jgi:hypothetical protein
MLALAKSVLGDAIRFDHQCDSSGRQPGDAGMGYHSHAYANEQPHVGYIRIFWYVNGFNLMDGNLKTVPGSHLFRDDTGGGRTDEDIMSWASGKHHLVTGAPLSIRKLECPPGSVVIMWTHATVSLTGICFQRLSLLCVSQPVPLPAEIMCHIGCSTGSTRNR